MTEPEVPTNEAEPLLERLVGPSLAAIGAGVDFVTRYFATRPWFLVPVAFPALLGLGLALAAAVMVWAIPDREIVTRLEIELRDAVTSHDLASQRICLQTLLAREPDSAEHQFAFALLHREEGDTASAVALLGRLAPSDSVGYAPAHRQLAEDALTQYENAGPEADLRALRAAALHHLKSSGRLDDPRLEYQMGVLCIDDGDLPLAELHLQQAAAQGYSVAHLVLSQLERQRGNLDTAEQHRRSAREGLQAYVLEHPDDREARLGWGRCLLDGGEWAALKPLLAHLRKDAERGPFRDRLGQLHLTAAQQHPLDSPTAVQAAVGYAREAFDLLEDPAPAAWQLIQFSRVPGTVSHEWLVRIQQWEQAAAKTRMTEGRLQLIAAGVAESLGDQAAAEAGYQAAAKVDPRLLCELASFYRRRRNTEKLAQTNAALIVHFESLWQQRPDDSTSVIVLAQAYASQQRWPEARRVMAKANRPETRVILAGLFVDEFAWVISSPPLPTQSAPAQPQNPPGPGGPHFAAYELLRLALLAVPDYPPAIRRWEAAVIAEAKAGGHRLEGLVTRLLAEGENPAAMHYLLGSRAVELRDWSGAIQHWEQARRLRPNDVSVLAHLAMALLHGSDSGPRLSEAETLVEGTLRRVPGHPELLALRGQIRARQQNDVAAVADLEAALSRLPERKALHRILADCYERLGNHELTRTHRGLAEPPLPKGADSTPATRTGDQSERPLGPEPKRDQASFEKK